MRNISFAMTTDQIRGRSKTVTRRLGWKTLTPGTLLQPVVKAQGLKKGEHVEKIGGPIRVLSVRREPLDLMTRDIDYGIDECKREGFANHRLMFPSAFVEFFCAANACQPDDGVTRIEFEYTEPAA